MLLYAEQFAEYCTETVVAPPGRTCPQILARARLKGRVRAAVEQVRIVGVEVLVHHLDPRRLPGDVGGLLQEPRLDVGREPVLRVRWPGLIAVLGEVDIEPAARSDYPPPPGRPVQRAEQLVEISGVDQVGDGVAGER